MAISKRVDTVRLQGISKAFWESAALMSAVELGVFTAIARGQNSIATLARAIDIEPLNAERLLTTLTAMDLLHRNDEEFSNADDVERFLVEDSNAYAGPWMLFGKPRWDGWGDLTARLKIREGEQRKLGMYDETFTVERARTYHQATYSIGMGAARRFHKQVDLSQRKKIMDIGGGSGCYCIIGAQQHPNLQAEVLDLAPVVTVTREFLAENGVANRVQATECDFTADAFPTDADVAIMASNLPQYGRETIAAVIRKTYDALLPGGEFHLIGEMLDPDGTGPLAPALWGLSEAVNYSTGLAHKEDECKAYFEQAGFKNISVNEFIPQTLTRITGYK